MPTIVDAEDRLAVAGLPILLKERPKDFVKSRMPYIY